MPTNKTCGKNIIKFAQHAVQQAKNCINAPVVYQQCIVRANAKKKIGLRIKLKLCQQKKSAFNKNERGKASQSKVCSNGVQTLSN